MECIGMNRFRKRWLKQLGAILCAAFMLCTSALLGVTFCLCTADEACGTAHCDCFETEEHSGCTAPASEDCTDITIETLDAVADTSVLKLVELPALLSPILIPQTQVFAQLHLDGFIPTTTAPPRPPSLYILTAHRLYPRS